MLNDTNYREICPTILLLAIFHESGHIFADLNIYFMELKTAVVDYFGYITKYRYFKKSMNTLFWFYFTVCSTQFK